MSFTPCPRCGASLPESATCDDCEREFYEKLALLEELCTASMNRQAEEMLSNIDSTPPVEVKDGEVLLLGFDGQVDGVIPMKERPIVFLRPLPLTLRQMMRYDPTPSTKPEPMRVAEYRRVGESTYQRET